MRRMVASCLLFVSGLACAADEMEGRAWLRPPAQGAGDWSPVPVADVYEVVASKEAVAVYGDLAEKAFVPLTEDWAKSYAGSHYRTEGQKKAFLVRAVYGHGGTGGYTVSRRGNELLVSHGSLGHRSAFHKSALVVNLDFTPGQIYNVVSIAE